MESIIEKLKRGIRISMVFTLLTNFIVIIALLFFNSNDNAEWTLVISKSTFYCLVLPSMVFLLAYELKEKEDNKDSFMLIKKEVKLVLWALISSAFILYILGFILFVEIPF